MTRTVVHVERWGLVLEEGVLREVVRPRTLSKGLVFFF